LGGWGRLANSQPLGKMHACNPFFLYVCNSRFKQKYKSEYFTIIKWRKYLSTSPQREERMKLIRKIEEATDSRMLVYLTGDRKNLETVIAHDALPFCLNHLMRMQNPSSISLFLYSTGGRTMAGYGLANLIREFCKKFIVIVPFKALSCATLITLGADEIIMTRIGQLSPIDPSIPHILGPRPSGYPTNAPPIPVSVEDVMNYLQMARDEVGIKDQDLLERVYDRLSQEIHPLALGSVYRLKTQIIFLAKSLLSTHMKEESKINEIVDTLYRGRYSHDYPIGRKEADEVIGLPIKEENIKLESLIMRLYEHYDKLLELSVPYSPELALGGEDSKTVSLNRAIIESDSLSHVFRSTHKYNRVKLTPPKVPTPMEVPMERLIQAQWVEDKDI